MKYPSDRDVVMVLCDDIRPEVGQKMGLLGVYIGDDIVFPPEAKELMLPTFCMMTWIRSGEGTCKFRFRVIRPNGESQTDVKDDIKLEKDAATVHVLKFVNAAFAEGKYEVEIYFDDTVYRRSFRVKKAPISA